MAVVDINEPLGPPLSTAPLMATMANASNETPYVSPRKAERAFKGECVGYRPNALTHSSRQFLRGALSLARSPISNQSFSDIINAVEAECLRQVVIVFLCDTLDNPDRKLDVVQHLRRWWVDGSIHAPSGGPHGVLPYISECYLYYVLIDGLTDDNEWVELFQAALGSYRPTSEEIGRRATELLIKHVPTRPPARRRVSAGVIHVEK